MDYDFKNVDTKLKAAEEWLKKEYGGLRTGRATPAILDGVQISAYGSMMPLKQVGNLSIEDARSIRITAYDASLIKDIEKGITAANLGVGTSSDGNSVRVTFPELTGERRTELVKLAKGKLEEARTSVRLARDESWKEIQEREREGTLTEDDKFALKEDLQERVDKTNGVLEDAFKAKEKEMTS
jgi:ribosome recycling factor